MHEHTDGEPTQATPHTTVERTSDREVTVTRIINGTRPIVFAAFTKAELFRRWWVPQSMGMTLRSCEMDARAGGRYRLAFDVGAPHPIEFFGSYVDVQPPLRLSWTNDESGEDGGSVTTVTFEEQGGTTLVVLRERYASKDALDATGMGPAEALRETFSQLDALLAHLDHDHPVR
jgi:uncharacterized protein YndB with AHSA1/START domain